MADPEYRYHHEAVTELRQIADLIGRGEVGFTVGYRAEFIRALLKIPVSQEDLSWDGMEVWARFRGETENRLELEADQLFRNAVAPLLEAADGFHHAVAEANDAFRATHNIPDPGIP